VWTLWQLCQSLQRRWTKTPRRNKQVWLPNICKRERFWSTETSNLNSIQISTLHFKIQKKTSLYSHPMLGKQRQQDSSRNTVRSSPWDSGEELKCVETKDADTTWREGRMKSQRKPQGTSCQELYWQLAYISFPGAWLLHRIHHAREQSKAI